MSIYGEFASVYDIMQYDIDYDKWIEQINKIAQGHLTGARNMLELACGTGTIGIGLAKKGFNIDALDISEDMLTVAQAKSYEAGVKIKFYNQDMVTFNTKKNYDVVFCMCDGFNYIIEEDHLIQVFENVHRHLPKGGIFIFDLSSHYKLKEVIGNHTFAETFEHEAYIWENEYDEASRQLDFTLTLFKEEEQGYQRYEEFHSQHAYEVEEIVGLTKPFFELIEIVDGDTFKDVHEKSHRICFIMKK